MIAFGTDNEEISRFQTSPFLLSMTDLPDNELSIIIALPSIGEEGEDLDLSAYPQENIEAVKPMLLKSCPVYEDEDNIFEIRFSEYVMYQCRNESYTVWDDEEVRIGKYLCIYEKSKLLGFYGSVVPFDWNDAETKAKRKHYGIFTQNHVIDIIANEPPVISKVINPECKRGRQS